MDTKAWLDAVNNAPSVTMAAQVVSNYLCESRHDHQVAAQLLAAFRARRLHWHAVDAATVDEHKRLLNECIHSLRRAEQLLDAWNCSDGA